MTDFGVKSEKLKKLARTPDIPEIVLQIQDEVSAEYTWLGAVLKEVKGEELSAYGAKFSQASMALDRVPAESEAYKLGLRSGEFIAVIWRERDFYGCFFQTAFRRICRKIRRAACYA